MIISRTPLRISFAGGGTDLPAFYHHQTGAVVSTAINKYIYITINKKFDHRIRASYSITEIVDSLDQLQHELIRESLRLTAIDGGIEITSISDIPSQGTGLGSSSAYTVGLLNALYAFKGQLADAERLAREACQIEIDILGRPIGKQDQYMAAYGGFKYMEFCPNEAVEVTPLLGCQQDRDRLQRNLLLLYTGITRSSNTILEVQNKNLLHRDGTYASLCQILAIAQEARDALHRREVERIGTYLHESWQTKTHLANGITNPTIDAWYQTALSHGAIGGKILGAGGGGFLLLYAPPDRQQGIIQALPELRHIPFVFEQQGSKIIYVEE